MQSARRHGLFVAFAALFSAGLTGDLQAANAVVGIGNAASCNEAALNAAVASLNAGGGTMTFNCGGPATINVTSEKRFFAAGATFTIDGFGLITLSGQNVTRIILHHRGTLAMRNITLQNGRASGVGDDASGGAIRSDRLDASPIFLQLTNVTFRNNASHLTAPLAGFSTFDHGGAAIFTRLGNLAATNCFFTNNTANNSSGGAIHGRSSTIDINGTTFTTNASNGGGLGGGVYTDGLSPNGSNGTLRVASSTFTNNTAFNVGGAFYFFNYTAKNESVTIDTVVFQGNRVLDNSGTIAFVGNRGIGGAGIVDAGNVTIMNSTFSGNTARSSTGPGSGGGLTLVENGSINITNSTFSGNRAEGDGIANASGGGLVVGANSQPFQIRNSTFTGNHAGWTGGGIQSDSNGVLTNTIVANNTAANPFNIQRQCGAQLTNGGSVIHFPNIIGTPTSGNPYCAAGALVVNPALLPLATNGGYAPSHGLSAGSPAINSGSCVVATDQRRVARPQGGGCDIGAFEFTPTPAPELVYRLRHPAIGAYLFTIFPFERDSAQDSFGYMYEGICCKWFGNPAADGRLQLHRLFSPSAGEYFFTISTAERDDAVARFGYNYEGVAAYCHPIPTPVAPTEWHRLRFGNKHLYTAFESEVIAATALGYIYEGVSCFLPNP